MKHVLLALVCGAALFAARPALAHSTSTSYLLLDVPAATAPVALRWDLAVHDIVWSVFIDKDYDGVVTWQEVLDARGNLEPAVLREISLTRGGAPCALQFKDVALAERAAQNYLSIALTGDCPKARTTRCGRDPARAGRARPPAARACGRRAAR